MKLQYYSDTDSLYIDLSQETSVESKEVAAGVVLDFGQQGQLVGIDIDQASTFIDLVRMEIHGLPVSSFSVAR